MSGLYSSINGAQDSNPAALTKVWESVMRSNYGGRREQLIGMELWSDANFEGVYSNRLIHTGLKGTALISNDDFKQRFPQPRYDIEAVTLYGMHFIGIYFEYELEPRRDFDPRVDLAPMLVGELGELLADAEEEDFLLPFNTGETFLTSREHSSPLFVDGISDELRVIGGEGLGHGNILYGSPSYGLIDSINAYGDTFVNDEFRPESLRPVMIMGSPRNIARLEQYYNTEYNIEAGNPFVRSPIQGQAAPRLLSTPRLYNSNDLFVFYEGWENDLLIRTDMRGEQSSGVGGADDVPQYRKAWTQMRTRHGMFVVNNRRILKVSGVAV